MKYCLPKEYLKPLSSLTPNLKAAISALAMNVLFPKPIFFSMVKPSLEKITLLRVLSRSNSLISITRGGWFIIN